MGTRLDESVQQQLITMPSQRTAEKAVVVSVDVETGQVTYVIDDVEHTALVMSGFMPSVGQPVQVAVNGNDRVVMPPAGVDPGLYGPIQTGEGPHVNPNPLVDAENLVGWDASFGATTWQFDATTESWASLGFTLSHDPSNGQNEGGGGGIVGSLKGVSTKSAALYAFSPIVTVLRDPDLATLASVWVKAGASGSETRRARVSIQWYNAAGTTLLMQTDGELVYDLNPTIWKSLDVSGFGPPNPADNKARLAVTVFDSVVAETYYLDNALLMAPTNTTMTLNQPLPTVVDDFNRADSTNVSTGSPFTWNERDGDWRVVSNQLQMLTFGASQGLITTELPTSYTTTTRSNFVMECTVSSTTASADGWGLVYRYLNTANNWKLVNAVGFTSLFLFRHVAGVSTTVGTVPTNVEPGDVVRIECDDSYHRIFVNNALLLTVNDSALSTNVNMGPFTNVNVPALRWDNFSIAPIEKAYCRPGRTSSLELKSIAAGNVFARTPTDLDVTSLPVVRKGEFWTLDGWVKQRRTNSPGTSVPLLYVFVMTMYDANGIFIANDFGGGFGPTSWEWSRMITTFEIKNEKAAYARVNTAFLALTADQEMYVSEIYMRKASVVTAPILRTDDEGPRLTTLPTPTGPQIRVFQGTENDGYSQMIHGYVYSGAASGTTDASGYLTFSHGLRNGQVPAAVFVQPQAPIAGTPTFGMAIVDSIQAETARLRAISAAGTAVASTAVTFHFLTVARP